MEAYRRYGPALMRKCRRMLQSEAAAEDIVQGLFVDLLQQEQTDPDLPYLYRAATNRCLNHLRDRENRMRLLSQHDSALRGPARTLCDERVISLDLLAKLLGRLDEAHSEVLVYRFYDDMGQAEIAQLLKTSRRTVVKRLRRIRDEVRKLGGEQPGGRVQR